MGYVAIGILLIAAGIYEIKNDKLYTYFYWVRRESEDLHDRMINSELFFAALLAIFAGIVLILHGLGIT